MKFCAKHWEALRTAITARGLGHTVAANGRDAFARSVAELEGKADLSDFDALMAAHNLILARAMDVFGLWVLRPAEDGQDPCPACDLIREAPPPPAGSKYTTNEEFFIEGPADATLAFAQENGIDKPLTDP